MRGLGRGVVGLLIAVTLSVALAAEAAAQEPPGRKSANVTWKASLPEPQVISARFDGTKMYVSTLKGLAVYDVANPAAPTRIGFLPLPHFENEDVDMSVGEDFVLISNDPAEGKGVLYVIDVSNPALPTVRSADGHRHAGPRRRLPALRHRPHGQLRAPAHRRVRLRLPGGEPAAASTSST